MQNTNYFLFPTCNLPLATHHWPLTRLLRNSGCILPPTATASPWSPTTCRISRCIYKSSTSGRC